MRLVNVPDLSGLEVLRLLADYGQFDDEVVIKPLTGRDFHKRYGWFHQACESDMGQSGELLTHLVKRALA